LNTNISILTDESTNISKEPNTSNIEQELGQLVDKASKNGKFIVIFYSGHGTQTLDEREKDFEIDGKDECWVFSDFRSNGFFTDDKLNSLFLNKLGWNVNVLVISDSCHSGSMADLSWTYNSSTKKVVNTRTRVDNIKPNIWQISGCMDSQYSEELEINGRTCGALTHCMSELLVKGKKITEIMNMSRIICKKLKLRQIPVLSCNKKELLEYVL
jgi:hypothetical protein